MLRRMSNPVIDCVANQILESMDLMDGLNITAAEKYARVAIEALRAAPELVYENYRCEKKWRELDSVDVLNLWIDAALRESK